MPDLPSAVQIRAYLRRKGWEQHPPGRAGSLWARGSYRVGVPHDDEDVMLIRGAIERIARAEGRSETVVAREMRREAAAPADTGRPPAGPGRLNGHRRD